MNPISSQSLRAESEPPVAAWLAEPNNSPRIVEPDAGSGEGVRPDRRRDRLGYAGYAIFAFALSAWMALFLIGATVNSLPYRDALTAVLAGVENSAAESSVSAATDVASANVAWLLVATLITFTVTNLPLLCCFASLLGALARRAEIGVEHLTRSPIDDTNPYVSAVIRGIFVYLFVISGLLVVVETPFDQATAAQYIRLAGFVSLLCFLLSHNPEMASRILTRAASAIEGRAGLDENGTDTPGETDR